MRLNNKSTFYPVLCGMLLFFLFLPAPSELGVQWGEAGKRGEPLSLQNSSIILLKNREYFPALKEAIDKAKREVALSFFRHNLTHSALKYNNEMSVMIESPQVAAEALEYIKSLLPNGGSWAR